MSDDVDMDAPRKKPGPVMLAWEPIERIALPMMRARGYDLGVVRYTDAGLARLLHVKGRGRGGAGSVQIKAWRERGTVAWFVAARLCEEMGYHPSQVYGAVWHAIEPPVNAPAPNAHGDGFDYLWDDEGAA